MAKAFYRTYRPQSFSTLYGQSHVKKTLENALVGGSFAHAYIFSGPRGVGKTTLARIMAKSLNCKNRKETESDPCNECENCVAIMNGSAVDIIEIDAASNRGIDEIRSLREKARTVPLALSYKVFIIDEVHMLTKEAFDALLKTLEEPKKHSLFVLATTEFEKIPKTIISRCQSFELKTIPAEELYAYLSHIASKENLSVSEEVLKYIVAFSGGYARDATSLLNQVAILDDPSLDEVKSLFGIPLEKDVIALFQALAGGDLQKAFDIIRAVVRDGRDVHHFSRIIQECARMMLLARFLNAQPFSYDLPLDAQSLKEITQLGEQIGSQTIATFLKLLVDLEEKLKDSYHPELFIELAVLEAFDVGNPAQPHKDSERQKKNDSAQSAQYRPELLRENPPSESKPVEKITPPSPAKIVSEANKPAPSVTPEEHPAQAAERDVKSEESPQNATESSAVNEVQSLFSTPEQVAPVKPTQPEPVKDPAPVEENASPTRNVQLRVTVDAIQARWNDLLAEISKANLSLAGLVKSTCILGIKNGTLVLVADFGFHRDKVNDPHNKEIISGALKKLHDEHIPVECVEKGSVSDEERAQIDKVKNAAAEEVQKAREESFNAAVEVFGVSGE